MKVWRPANVATLLFSVFLSSSQPSAAISEDRLELGLTQTAANEPVVLQWNDPYSNETRFTVERAHHPLALYHEVASLATNVKTFQDSAVVGNVDADFVYRVKAWRGTEMLGASNASMLQKSKKLDLLNAIGEFERVPIKVDYIFSGPGQWINGQSDSTSTNSIGEGWSRLTSVGMEVPRDAVFKVEDSPDSNWEHRQYLSLESCPISSCSSGLYTRVVNPYSISLAAHSGDTLEFELDRVSMENFTSLPSSTKPSFQLSITARNTAGTTTSQSTKCLASTEALPCRVSVVAPSDPVSISLIIQIYQSSPLSGLRPIMRVDGAHLYVKRSSTGEYVLTTKPLAPRPAPASGKGNFLFPFARINQLRADPSYDMLKYKFFISVAEVLDRTPPITASVDEDYRDYEDRLLKLIIAYLISDDAVFLDKALLYVDRILGYEKWDYWAGNDLVTSHFIMGLAYTFEYLYEELGEERRQKLVARLKDELDTKFKSGYLSPSIVEKRLLLGNHLWINYASLYLGAIALRNELGADIYTQYLNRVSSTLNGKIIPILPPDGSPPEEADYAMYGLTNLAKILEVKKYFEGLNLYNSSTFFQKIMYYVDRVIAPGGAYFVNVGDSPYGQLWNPPTSLACRFAAEFGDRELQTLADSYPYSPSWSGHSLYSLLWCDLRNVSLDSMPSSKGVDVFEQSGTMIYRSDKSYANDGLFLYFASSPLKTGHAHPDHNSFVLYYKKQPLIADHGYNYWKSTQEHNTLLVNGLGQIGDHYIWLHPLGYFPDEYKSPFAPDIFCNRAQLGSITIDERLAFAQATGNATNAYPLQAELDLYERTLSIIGNYVFVVDEVLAKNPKQLEIRFHNADMSKKNDQNNRFTMHDFSASYQITSGDVLLDIYRDQNKKASIVPTYFYPPQTYSNKTEAEQCTFIGNYARSKGASLLARSVEDVFDDFSAAGFPPLQHGFHLSLKTSEAVKSARFSNLLVAREAKAAIPLVNRIAAQGVNGYLVEDSQKTIAFLTAELGEGANWQEFSFSGRGAVFIRPKDGHAAWGFPLKSGNILQRVATESTISIQDEKGRVRNSRVSILLNPSFEKIINSGEEIFYQLSNDSVSWSAEALFTSKLLQWDLLPGDGIKKVYVRFRLGSSSWTIPAFDETTLDTTAPKAPLLKSN